MKWMEALKQYNSGKGMWCIPKKGSPEYFDVRALMNYDTAKDIEARNVERREKSVAQLREATKNMKPGVRVDVPVKAKEAPKEVEVVKEKLSTEELAKGIKKVILSRITEYIKKKYYKGKYDDEKDYYSLVSKIGEYGNDILSEDIGYGALENSIKSEIKGHANKDFQKAMEYFKEKKMGGVSSIDYAEHFKHLFTEPLKKVAVVKHISPELKKKFIDDTALETIYGNDIAGKKRIASLISDMDKVLSGKKKPETSISEQEPGRMTDRNAYTYKSKSIYDVGPKIPKDTYKKFERGMNGFDLMYYSKDLKSLMADLPGNWILQPIETDNVYAGFNTVFMGMIDMKPGVRVDEPPKSYFVDIEGYLDKLIKIYLVEGGIEGAKDNNVEEVYEKIKDGRDYVEYLTEALDYFGGEDEVAEKIWTYFTVKKKIPKKYVVSAMKSMREDGYSMFDDYIKK